MVYGKMFHPLLPTAQQGSLSHHPECLSILTVAKTSKALQLLNSLSNNTAEVSGKANFDLAR